MVSEILITMGMSWPVSSDKQKVPLVSAMRAVHWLNVSSLEVSLSGVSTVIPVYYRG